jgi:hypothetical protein
VPAWNNHIPTYVTFLTQCQVRAEEAELKRRESYTSGLLKSILRRKDVVLGEV